MATALIDTAIINATAAMVDGNPKPSNSSAAKEFENIFENITKTFDSKKDDDTSKTNTEEKALNSGSKEEIKDNKPETVDSEAKAQTDANNEENTKTESSNQAEEKVVQNQPEQTKQNSEEPAAKTIVENISATAEILAAAGENLTLIINNAASDKTVNQNTPAQQASVFAQNTQNQTQATTAAQAQTQEQILAQIKSQTTQNTATTPTENVTGPQNSSQNILPQKQVEAATQSPVIKVNTEIAASDINLNKDAGNITNQDNKNLQTNPTITQEMIDETNAKITRVETASNQNSNNLMNRQNAQEQAIKLSLQGGDKTNNFTNAADTANPSFDVPLEHLQTKPAQAPNITQAPKELNSNEIISQINNKLENLREEGTTRVNIVLKPEGLGRISVELINGKDGLVAKMTTDNADVKQLLDKNIDKLKDSIGSQGINVNNVSVKVSETQKQDTTFSFDNKQEQANQQMSDNSGNAERRESSSTSENGSFFEEKITSDTLIESETDFISSDSEKIDYRV